VSAAQPGETGVAGGARLRAVATLLALALLLPAALAFWGTAASTSAARIASMHTVEPYAFAVQEQLAYNFGLHGTWVQTIHAGYDDTWTWSGHRAITFVLAAGLYALRPDALWLSELQILGMLLGVIPAALIGRRALASPWGLLLGGLLYLLSPALMALALQDYQDLCLATPFLVFTLWSMRARQPLWALVGAAVGVMPREECVPLVLACALVTLPPSWRGSRWRRYGLNVVLALAVAGTYAALAQLLFPIRAAPGPAAGHDTPLVNAVKTVLAARSMADLPGLPGLHSFYALTWAPVGLLALLSPLTALPGAGLLLMHMTVPDNNGVDRSWFGHAHHMAPALAFLIVATIEGAARLLRGLAAPRLGRWRPSLGPLGPALATVAGLGLGAYCLWWVQTWGDSFHLVWSWQARRTDWEHPSWTLARRLPAQAVPVVSVRDALAVADRSRSYTWEESLHDKGRGQGLGAATHLIAPRALGGIVAWGMAMPGARIVDEADGYVTLTWDPGAQDTAGHQREERWPELPEWLPPGTTTDRLPGVPPRRR